MLLHSLSTPFSPSHAFSSLKSPRPLSYSSCRSLSVHFFILLPFSLPFLTLGNICEMGIGKEESPATAILDVGTPWLHSMVWWWPPSRHVPRKLSITNSTFHSQWMVISSKFITVYRNLGVWEVVCFRWGWFWFYFSSSHEHCFTFIMS